jgi:hypothetical protein
MTFEQKNVFMKKCLTTPLFNQNFSSTDIYDMRVDICGCFTNDLNFHESDGLSSESSSPVSILQNFFPLEI